jgi:hypothetical protein
MRKGASNEIFCAEFQELVNKKYNDLTRIYTDGSKKKEKVGYAVVTDQQYSARNKKTAWAQYRNYRQCGSEE